MAITIEMRIDNTNKVLDNLKDAKTRALMKCGAVAENYAKKNAPVDTGRLRNSINHAMQDQETVAIGTDVEYAIYQELGTSKGVSAKRYLTNAVQNHLPEYQNIIKEEFRKG